jgi:excinuclease ABC subunit C
MSAVVRSCRLNWATVSDATECWQRFELQVEQLAPPSVTESKVRKAVLVEVLRTLRMQSPFEAVDHDMPRTRRDQPPLPGLTDSDPFRGFGTSTFRAAPDESSGFAVRERDASKLKEIVRTQAPRTPGVYGMVGAKGQIIYVGKAKNLRARLLSYFRESSDRKASKIIRHTRMLLWEFVPDEFAALLRELELIRRFRPRYNVLGQPGRQRYVYLCLGRAPAAYLYITREPTGKELAAYGPFVGRQQSRDAVRRFNLEFRLRDCPSTVRMVFADQAELFNTERSAKCLRYELGTCPGPCGAFCTTKQYGTNTKAARAFLDGKDCSKIADVTKQMNAASTEFRFEQAAIFRDRLASLNWLSDKLAFLRTARANHSFVYPFVGSDNLTRWYLIHGGVVQSVVREPNDAASASHADAALHAVFDQPFTTQSTLERCVDSVLIVTSWFRKRPTEKAALLTRKQSMGRCQSFIT